MLASVYSAGITGIDGFAVTVECNVVRSQNAKFDIVGLPDLAAAVEIDNLFPVVSSHLLASAG